MRAVLLAGSIGALLIGFTQSTNPILISDFESVGISAIPGNPIPSMGWYGIAAALFAGYMFSIGGNR